MKQVKIAVLSNIHYMADSLLAYPTEVNNLQFVHDRMHKAMLDFSGPILDASLNELAKEKPDVVLIPGDLTKDGERVSHSWVVSKLQQLRQPPVNAKVYVIPGICDINSAQAKKYDSTVAPGYALLNNSQKFVTKDDFFGSAGYSDFGYGTALYKDSPNSYSYVAEPVQGLWILAIDAIDFSDGNINPGKRKGIIKKETMKWIESILQKNSTLPVKNTVLAIVYHNVVEHFIGQSSGLPYTMLNSEDVNGNVVGWDQTARKLLDMGLNLVFTAATHAIDMTSWSPTGSHNGKLLDVQAAASSSYKIVDLVIDQPNPTWHIKTKQIRDIDVSPRTMFEVFKEERYRTCVEKYFRELTVPFVLTPEEVKLSTDAFLAHLNGNETKPPQEQVELSLNPPRQPFADQIATFWNDLVPDDYVV